MELEGHSIRFIRSGHQCTKDANAKQIDNITDMEVGAYPSVKDGMNLKFSFRTWVQGRMEPPSREGIIQRDITLKIVTGEPRNNRPEIGEGIGLWYLKERSTCLQNCVKNYPYPEPASRNAYYMVGRYGMHS